MGRPGGERVGCILLLSLNHFMLTRKRSGQVHHLIREVHVYLGLFNFSIFIVFGIAGLVATFSPPHEGQEPPPSEVRTVPFTVPAGLTDKQVADLVHAELDLPLTGPIPEWAIARNEGADLQLDFYTVNGPFQVTVLEDTNQLRVETHRNSLGRYLSNLHAMVMYYENSGDWRAELWTYYVELSLWSLTLMALSGMYLWLYARPRYRPAALATVSSFLIFAILYVLTR